MCDFHASSIKTVALTVVWSGPIGNSKINFWTNLAFRPWKKPVQLSVSYAILFSIQKYMIGHIFRAIEVYLRILEYLTDLRQHDNHQNSKKSQILTNYYKNVSYHVFFDAEQVCIAVWKLYRASFMVKKPNRSKNWFCHCWLAHFKPLRAPQLWCQGHENCT